MTKRFEILTNTYPAELSRQVEELLNEGWERSGDLKVAMASAGGGHTHVVYVQPMAKEEDDDPWS